MTHAYYVAHRYIAQRGRTALRRTLRTFGKPIPLWRPPRDHRLEDDASFTATAADVMAQLDNAIRLYVPL